MALDCVLPGNSRFDRNGDYSIPLTVKTIVTPVRFRSKAKPEESITISSDPKTGTQLPIQQESCNIFDVLETNRPPELPQYWFYPPDRLGPFHWTTEHRSIGKGLANYANTCFLNATIQALSYCPPFAHGCLSGKHSSRCLRKQRNQVCGFCLFELHVKGLFDASESQQNSSDKIASFPPMFVKLLRKEIRMNQGFNNWFGFQNCAHEWLVQFLDFLSKYDLPPDLQKDFEAGRIRGSDLATCYLHQLFSACFQESKICQVCNKSTVNYELNTCIRLSITDGSSSLEGALQKVFRPELLTSSNRPM